MKKRYVKRILEALYLIFIFPFVFLLSIPLIIFGKDKKDAIEDFIELIELILKSDNSDELWSLIDELVNVPFKNDENLYLEHMRIHLSESIKDFKGLVLTDDLRFVFKTQLKILHDKMDDKKKE